MMFRSVLALVCVMVAAVVSGACDNGPSTSPSPNPGNPVTETFTGQLRLNGSITHTFTTAAAGTVTATITSVDPTGSVVGFQLGTFNTVTCSAVVSNDLATAASVLSGGTQSAASLCVKMHDPNGVIAADASVNYTLTVSHF
jgi:hypothetical protein